MSGKAPGWEGRRVKEGGREGGGKGEREREGKSGERGGRSGEIEGRRKRGRKGAQESTERETG